MAKHWFYIKFASIITTHTRLFKHFKYPTKGPRENTQKIMVTTYRGTHTVHYKNKMSFSVVSGLKFSSSLYLHNNYKLVMVWWKYIRKFVYKHLQFTMHRPHENFLFSFFWMIPFFISTASSFYTSVHVLHNRREIS